MIEQFDIAGNEIYIYIYIHSIYIMWTKGYVIKQSLKLRTVDLWTYICFVTNHYWWQWLFVGLNVQLYSWQDQVTSIILVTLTRVPDYDRKFSTNTGQGTNKSEYFPLQRSSKDHYHLLMLQVMFYVYKDVTFIWIII